MFRLELEFVEELATLLDRWLLKCAHAAPSAIPVFTVLQRVGSSAVVASSNERYGYDFARRERCLQTEHKECA